MKKLFSVILASVGAVLLVASAAGAQGSISMDTEAKKVFVCKYVGTPGEDERLQTGNNPISVSVNAIPDYNGVGSSFADAQGRSYVLAEDNRTGGGQEGEPGVESCPEPDGPPPPPTDVCPNINGNQATVPDGMVKDSEGNCVTLPPPPVDLCPNIDGDQATIPGGLVVDGRGFCVEVPLDPPVIVYPDTPPVIEPPVIEPPVIEPPVVEPPVVEPPEPPVVEPSVVERPPVVVAPTPPSAVEVPTVPGEVPAAVGADKPEVLGSQLAATGSSDSLPVLAFAGFGLLVIGLALTRRASRI